MIVRVRRRTRRSCGVFLQHRRALILLASLLPVLLHTALRAAPAPSTAPDKPQALRWVVSPGIPGQAYVEVSGWTPARLEQLAAARLSLAAWQHAFPVFATSGQLAIDITLPPMLGAYAVTNGMLRFSPRWPLQPGVGYRAVLWPDRLPGHTAGPAPATPLSAFLELPRVEDAPWTRVVSVHPESDVVPENLLKFYLHFSAPMARGQSYEHVLLADDAGRLMELPFLELAEELWDPGQQRLTLFIDPGRIKREVKPLEDLGPVFVEGRQYTLTITNTWRDAHGHPLAQVHTKRFRVGPADRTPPDPQTWTLNPVPAGSRNPVRVEFHEPLDPALATRLLEVLGPGDKPVAGRAQIESAGSVWTFVPDDPWTQGMHTLVVPSQIEDLAGNNVGKPFEVDLFDPVTVRPITLATRRQFRVE